jgi:Membrane bound O-acyl transferase family
VPILTDGLTGSQVQHVQTSRSPLFARMEPLKSLFANKLDQDLREPLARLSLAGSPYVVYAPSLSFWAQALGVSNQRVHVAIPTTVTILLSHWLVRLQLLTMQQVFQYAFAYINYKFVVQKRSSTTAALVAFGVSLPLSLYIPFCILEHFDIRNHAIKLTLASLGTIVGFRTFEAYFDTSPPVVETSLGTYMTYYTCLVHYDWDSKTVTRKRASLDYVLRRGGMILFHYAMLCPFLSFLMHYNFEPFHSKVDLAAYNINKDLLTFSHIGNTYLLAILTYLALCTFFELNAYSENIKGCTTKPVFYNPLFKSRSPTEFWGQRWNLAIHRALKHGVYLPSRKYVSNGLAIFLTFVASGLLHDYSWALVFYHHTSRRNEAGVCEDCFSPFPFKLSAFFAWNGCIMLLQKWLGRYFGFTRKWPTPVLSTLVLLTSLPVSHWYTGDWAMGGYFSDLSIGLFHIRKL